MDSVIKNGDLIKFLQSDIIYFAEKVDETDTEYIIFKLIKHDNTPFYKYSRTIEILDKQEIDLLEISKNDGNYVEAWYNIGVEIVNPYESPKNQRFKIPTQACDQIEITQESVYDSDSDTWSTDYSIESIESFIEN